MLVPMTKDPAERKMLSNNFELVRLVLTLLAVVGYLVFAAVRAVLFSPDFRGAVQECTTLRGPDSDLDIIRDVGYVTPADPHRSGDLYLPMSAGRRRPVVILIHGGSRKEGSRDFEKENARYLSQL